MASEVVHDDTSKDGPCFSESDIEDEELDESDGELSGRHTNFLVMLASYKQVEAAHRLTLSSWHADVEATDIALARLTAASTFVASRESSASIKAKRGNSATAVGSRRQSPKRSARAWGRLRELLMPPGGSAGRGDKSSPSAAIKAMSALRRVSEARAAVSICDEARRNCEEKYRLAKEQLSALRMLERRLHARVAWKAKKTEALDFASEGDPEEVMQMRLWRRVGTMRARRLATYKEEVIVLWRKSNAAFIAS
eukprot:TRINITY_DN54505_c0_g1_i1.p1 TRINITY_DN54505_c0_g1~~TRINITY_DN54505_c0_g1_i1.p1  ORF type:complete len:275 (+),score=32.70 TRINITY_DN54505_c0_g1_i1:65-826(+)